VAEYRQGFSVNGSPCSIVLWFFMPELPVASFADFDDVAGQLRDLVLVLVGNLASSQCQDSDLTVLAYGDRPLSIRSTSTGFVGSRGAASPLNASTGIYWATNERGKSGRAITHVPGFPLAFTDDDVHVNGTCVDAVRLAAAGFLVGLEDVHAGAILSATLCTLHRSSGGVPLSSSRVALIDHGLACPRVAGIQRRLRSGR